MTKIEKKSEDIRKEVLTAMLQKAVKQFKPATPAELESIVQIILNKLESSKK